LSTRRVTGLLLGFFGIVLLVWPELAFDQDSLDSTGPNRAFLYGVIATQLACAGWAVGSSLARRRHSDENVLGAAAMQMIFAGFSLIAAGTIRGEWSMVAFTGRTSTALAYLIVAGSVVGYSAYAYALKHLPVATVSVYALRQSHHRGHPRRGSSLRLQISEFRYQIDCQNIQSEI
jgi:drug/metabolite transporter (DMT)-like permease